MVRFNVPISDILGNAYYRYELTANNYNLTVNNNVTIYCKVETVFGGAVAGKSVTLYRNDTSVGTATTNENGVASWTVTLTTNGNYNFTVETSTIVVKVRGIKNVSTATYGTMYVNESERTVFFKYYRSSYNITSTSYITLHTGACGDYKPITETYLASYNPTMTMLVTVSGDIKLISTGTGQKVLGFTGYWHY